MNQIVDASIFGVGLYRPEKRLIEYSLAIENGKRYAPYTRSADDKNQFAVWCIDHRQAILINDVEKESSKYISTYTHTNRVLDDGSAAQPPASMIYLPLVAQERILGVVSIQSFKKNTYREVRLIEQLSEQLAAILNSAAVARSALAQAQRLIPASHGSVLLMGKDDGLLQRAASFGDTCGDSADDSGPLGPASRFAASTLERGVGEIVNNCVSDSRALDSECTLKSLICAPLRAGQRTVGVIALANNVAGSSYSAADLKLLNTIALQTAAAVENSLLCAEMVETARERAAFAAELQAASTVQQLLLQSASRPTPGFQVESVYLPASEVGGDFFFVSPAPDGSLGNSRKVSKK